MSNEKTFQGIRSRIKSELPDEAFKRTPSKAWLIPISNCVIAASMYAAINYELPWYGLLGISLVLGHQFFVMGIMSHDIMHGATLKSKRMRLLVSFFGFYPFLISPRLWDLWHNRAHHGHTNTVHDPDANLTIDEVNKNKVARFGSKLMPSARNRLLGIIFYAYWFTLVGQAILWAGSHFKDWKTLDDRQTIWKARIDTLVYYCFWLTLVYSVGSYLSIFIVVIPMMLGNIVFMSFASSQHVFLPQSEFNEPINNSASLLVPKWIDKLTLNFSNHVEHHLFPAMSYEHTPKVRNWLRENMKETYMEHTMMDTYRLVFNTPRLYHSKTLLMFPDQDPSQAIDTDKIRDTLRSNGFVGSKELKNNFAVMH